MHPSAPPMQRASMRNRFPPPFLSTTSCWLLLCLCVGVARANPAASSVALFNAYAGSVELRLAQQHRSASGFLAQPASQPFGQRLSADLVIERLSPPSPANSTDALIHHWRATAFAPGATAADVERILRGVDSYPAVFSPQVIRARVLLRRGDQMSLWMRVREHHVLTVVLDSTYDVTFGRLNPQHGYSISRSTQISEIGSPGTPAEHPLSTTEEHGFLWRQMTCWSYEERDGGVYLQLESISLSRAIPHGLAWAISPYVESIPRDSLTFTMRSVIDALSKH